MNIDTLQKFYSLFDSIEQTIKDYPKIGSSRKKTSSDNEKKLKIAVQTAEDICDHYSQVQHNNRQADGDQRITRLELEILGNTNLPPLRPRYKYWTEFSPEVGIEVLKTLKSSVDKVGAYLQDRINRLIKKLEVILKPFRISEPTKISNPSLGLKSYKFSSYANWINSYPDHQMSYALWRECGFE
jgi:hypothetical protein